VTQHSLLWKNWLMRYVFLIVAYMVVSFIVSLAITVPNRPVSVFDYFLIAAVILPIVAVFDFVGQKLLESSALENLPQGSRLIAGLLTLGAFAFSAKFVVGFMNIEMMPW